MSRPVSPQPVVTSTSRAASCDVKKNYWDVTDAQVIEKTEKPLEHWMQVLARFGAADKPSTASVEHLQSVHGVPRYWARTLTTRFLKLKR